MRNHLKLWALQLSQVYQLSHDIFVACQLISGQDKMTLHYLHYCTLEARKCNSAIVQIIIKCGKSDLPEKEERAAFGKRLKREEASMDSGIPPETADHCA